MKIIRRACHEHLTTDPSSSIADLPDLLKRVLTRRSIKSSTEVSLQLSDLIPSHLLFGVDEAAAIVCQSVSNNKTILIVGDYDADGATATALMHLVLTRMNAKVDYYSTNRFVEGYGLSAQLVDQLHESRKFDLIITVDLGISAHEGVSRAKELGYQIIITDHHLPPDDLPEADAIVNPKLPQCQFPSKNLAGVGVAFYLLAVVRQHLLTAEWFSKNQITVPNLAQYLDLVALGTVADMMQLDQNNRILVAKGLDLIRQGQCRLGLLAMIATDNKSTQHIDCQDLSFQIIPRLNSVGRLSDMAIGVSWLLADNKSDAMKLTKQLITLNNERKIIEQKIITKAVNTINADLPYYQISIVLVNDAWHQGVIGIIAGKLKEQFQKPVFIFTRDSDNLFKGSGRSVEGLNLHQVLKQMDTQSPDLLVNFGGHAMAAGVTIHPESFQAFKTQFNQIVQTALENQPYELTLQTDGDLLAHEFSLDSVRYLRTIPWGNGFPTPIFDGEFRLMWLIPLGKQHLRFRVHIDEGRHVECIAFNTSMPKKMVVGAKVRLVYELRENYFKGTSSSQLLVKHLQIVS